MWMETVDMPTFLASGRWKVEFFEPTTLRLAESVYTLIRIGDLVVERGEALDPQEYPDHTFHFLGLEHVESHTGDLVGYAPARGKTIKSRSKVFREHDLLYGRLRPYLNKVMVAESPLSTGICSGEFYVLVPDQKRIEPRFLRELLASRFVSGRTANRQTGSALPRLQIDDLLEIAVPVPPLEVQRALADVATSLAQARREFRCRMATDHPRFLESLETVLSEGGEVPRQDELCIPDTSPPLDDLGLPDAHRRPIRSRGSPQLF